MGISKKNSRPITVKDRKYRWSFSVKWIEIEDEPSPSETCWGRVLIVIAPEDIPGSKIVATEVQILLHYSDPQRIYKPSTIEILINHAVDNGWSPNGPDYQIPDMSNVLDF
jgi:hypothetical protein